MNSETAGTVSQAPPKELAERCLRGNSHLSLKTITCEYLSGVLILRGFVGTYYLKQVAQTAVSQLDGVERIDNQIQVVTPYPRRD